MHKVVICGLDTASLPNLSNQESKELMQAIKIDKDMVARERFIMANLRLVLSMVQRFDDKYDSDDLFQVGCVGLLKAVDNFDLKYNVQFSTYAVPMILGEMRKLVKESTSIKVSRSMRDIAYQALQAREKLEMSQQKDVSMMEIAEEIGQPLAQVACALNAISEPVSLYECVYSDSEDSLELIDQICDEHDLEQEWSNAMTLDITMASLSDKERQVLTMRYYDDKTQVEIAKEIGVSQAQVSRLEKLALEKMKRQFA